MQNLMFIDIPFIEDKDLQRRFEEWLINRGNDIVKVRSIAATTFRVNVRDSMDAFWIGCNYVAISNKLFDGPLTKTLG